MTHGVFEGKLGFMFVLLLVLQQETHHTKVPTTHCVEQGTPATCLQEIQAMQL